MQGCHYTSGTGLVFYFTCACLKEQKKKALKSISMKYSIFFYWAHVFLFSCSGIKAARLSQCRNVLHPMRSAILEFGKKNTTKECNPRNWAIKPT